MQRQREHRIADPRHRQIRQVLVVGTNALGRREPVGDARQIGVRQHHAFRPRGRARGVREQRQIVGFAFRQRRPEEIGVGGGKLAPGRLQFVERGEQLVVVIAQAPRVVIDQPLQMRQRVLQRQHLVDLLLVLGDDHRSLGVFEHKGQFAGDRVLINRDGNAARGSSRRAVRNRAGGGSRRSPTACRRGRSLVPPAPARNRAPPRNSGAT